METKHLIAFAAGLLSVFVLNSVWHDKPGAEKNAEERERIAEADAESPRTFTDGELDLTEITGADFEEVLARLVAVWSSSSSTASPRELAALTDRLKSAHPSELFAICKAIEDPRLRAGYAEYVVDFLAESNPRECIEFAKGEPESGQPDLARVVLRKWVVSAPAEATGWFLENELGEKALLGDPRNRDLLTDSMTNHLGKAGMHAEALTLIAGVTGKRRRAAGVDGLLSSIDPEKLASHAERLRAIPEDPKVRGVLTERIGYRLASSDLEEAKQWASALGAGSGASDGVAKSWIKQEPKIAAEWWLEHCAPENRDRVYSEIIDHWADTSPNDCGRWLASQTQGAHLDLARASFAMQVAARDPDSAMAWIDAIEDEALRESTRLQIR